MNCTVGLDPGLHGGIALIGPTGVLERASDLLIVRDGKLAWVDGCWLQSWFIDSLQGRRGIAVVERVSSMPGQGVASSFQFGVGFGSLLSIIQARHIALELVTAAVWKRGLGLSKDKQASLDRAHLLFPETDLRHDGVAEAALLAHWRYTNHHRDRPAAVPISSAAEATP